jgi:transposase
MRLSALDDLLPEEHRARLVWEMVQGYDLGGFYAGIAAVEGNAGRPAIDPRILVALWLYATLEGVGSARELDRLCQEHLAYQWLLGGVTVNYHTLADFRVEHERELDRLLSHSVAALMQTGLVKLEHTAQDGIRVRASAGSNSFHRRETLEKHLAEAQARVEQLKAHTQDGEESRAEKRSSAARQRQAREQIQRLEKALQEIQQVEAQKAKDRTQKRKNKPARASSTDPEVRVMKMSNGGFNPAYNGQVCIDMDSRIIVGVEISNQTDTYAMTPMLEQMEVRYAKTVGEHYVDGGYRNNAQIEAASAKGVQVFTPIPASYSVHSRKRPEEILPKDGPGVRSWKERMQTQAAKDQYGQRAATIEWANALLRNRGLTRFIVRGLRKARAILLWFALAHNLLQTLTLRRSQTAATPT